MNKNLAVLFSIFILLVIVGKPIYDISLQFKLTATELVDEFEEEGEDDSRKEKDEKPNKKETEEGLRFNESCFLNLSLIGNFSAEIAKIASHFADNLTNIILELDTPPPK